ncbi:MAG: hypothetical protein IPJ65_12630 [Archangiaceae bacterium]|nr:hypothetical protein [Archangiaceae bacterium]
MRNFALLLVLATTACRGPGTKPVECGEGYTDCGDCVNLQNDPRHCGACDHACGSTEECVLGMCQLECGDGMHLCNGVCVSNGSTETCGARCTPCPTADGGVATCDGLTCGLTCEPQLRHCGAACATCPSGVGVKCMNELCVPSGCPLGQHLCDGDCVDENGGSCGEQCLRCPAPPMNGTAVCLNGGCEYLCRAGNRFCGSGCCAADFLEAGGYHSCMLNPGGGVLCWGRNHVDTTRGGALGNDSIVDHAQPFAVNGLSSGMVAVQLGEHHTCALSQLGAVSCWGYAEGGRLGDGSSSDKLIPMALTSLGTGSTIALSAGGTGGCALSLRGEARCWGQNAHGEVGDGTTDARDTPTLVADLGTAVIDVSFGGSHACALMRGGTVRCWGDNSRGQLGDATQTERHRPALVMGVFDAVWLSAGEQHLRGAQGRRGAVLGRQHRWSAGAGRRRLSRHARQGRRSRRGQPGRGRWRPLVRAARHRRGAVLGRERVRPARRRHHHGPRRARRGERALGGHLDLLRSRAHLRQDPLGRALLGQQCLRPARRRHHRRPAHSGHAPLTGYLGSTRSSPGANR